MDWFLYDIDLRRERVKRLLTYRTFPANIYFFEVNNRNIRKRCKICSKLTITIFTVNFEHISRIFLVSLLLL